MEFRIEKDSLDEYLLQPIRYEMLRRGVVLPIRPLNAPQDRAKDEFIMGLQPFFRAGDIVVDLDTSTPSARAACEATVGNPGGMAEIPGRSVR